MDVRRIALLVAACCIATGCRKDPLLDAHIELLNAEKRALEDRIYELNYEYELKVDELKDARSEIERLRKKPGAEQGSDRGGFTPAPRPDRGPDLSPNLPDDVEMAPPTIEFPSEAETDELRPPRVDPGVPGQPSIELPPTSRAGAVDTIPVRGTSSALPIDPSDPTITQIYIDPQRTGGSNLDRKPGADALTLVLEPRNADGTYVPLAGPISVVLLDPAELGEAKRVARWDLDASDVDRSMRADKLKDGIRLTLAWPENSPPDHDRLHVFVRYETVDGRKLEAELPIKLKSEQLSQQWTPRAAPKVDAPSGEAPANIARPEWKPFR
jgi:hypothetical protein